MIIRHGQSQNNALYDNAGSYEERVPDPELTPLGHQQALCLGQAMANGAQPAPDVLYSSLMTRSVQTATALADALDLPFFGQLEAYECGGMYSGSPANPEPHPGASASELKAISPRLQLPPEVSERGWYRPQNQDPVSCAARGARVVADLKRRHNGDDVLIGLVCHEWISQHLFRAAIGFHPRAGIAEPWFSLNNTGTILIDFESPVPATEALNPGVVTERLIEWLNNCTHLTPDQITG